MMRVYLDNASTTQIDPRVLKEIVFHLKNTFGNAGSIHKEGVEAKKVLAESRKKIAEFFGAHSDEIVFTSGGTESNNLAILGIFKSRFGLSADYLDSKPHVITTEIEHSSTLECFKQLEKEGVDVTYLSVNEEGIVNLSEFKKALRPETVLVSIQYANNEIGVVQPIREISKALRHFRNNSSAKSLQLKVVENRGAIFHTDASQTPAYLDCNVERLGVDLLTIDGQKIYGPKGVGALYVKRGTLISPIILGGGQEGSLRSGTENVPMIAGLAKAFEICGNEREKESKRLTKLRNYFYSELFKMTGTKMILNGDLKNRLPNNLNFSIKGVDTEFLTLQLDAKGFAVSTKSACLDSGAGSYVIRALGGGSWRSKNSLRITFGRWTTMADCSKLILVLKKILKK